MNARNHYLQLKRFEFMIIKIRTREVFLENPSI